MKLKYTQILILGWILICVFSTAGFCATITVNSSQSIQEAIDAAISGDKVVVLDGRYSISQSLNFKGKAITVTSANGATNCILDGAGELITGIVFDQNESNDTKLSGFTITNFASGGIFCNYSSPIIANCNITLNKSISDGGGILSRGGSPTISNCTITKNIGNSSSLSNGGGGLAFDNTSLGQITNCLITNNYGGRSGGGIYLGYKSSVVVSNSVIANNESGYGSGIMIADASPVFNNCTIANNRGTGAIWSYASGPTINNCILWNESTWCEIYSRFSRAKINYCNIRGGDGGIYFDGWYGYDGMNNINTDPLFLNVSNNDCHLNTGSLCINAGNNDLIKEIIDLDGSQRIIDGTVDIGAYEYKSNHPPVISPIGDKKISEGQLLSFVVKATDPDGNKLTYSASNLPPGASFDQATQTFSWTPGYDQAGNYANVEFAVTDDGFPNEIAVELITITVGEINRYPVLEAIGSLQAIENQQVEFYIKAYDPDGDALTYSTSKLPAGATFDANTRRFVWTPIYGQAGIYTISFYATDNGNPNMTGETTVIISISQPGPEYIANEVLNAVIELPVPTQVKNTYIANIKKLESFIADGKKNPAINQLTAFISKVEHDFNNGIISPSERNRLVQMASELIGILTN